MQANIRICAVISEQLYAVKGRGRIRREDLLTLLEKGWRTKIFS